MSAESETPGATTAAAPAEKPADSGKEVKDAYNHLMQGKRHLLVRDYPSAVASLADACALLAGKVGDLAPECGEFYLYYGKALLELARAEAGVIEMAPPKSDSDEEEDDDEDKDSKDEEDKDSKDEEDKESKEDKEESESKDDSDEASKSGEDEAAKDGEEDKAKTEKEAKKNDEEEVVKNGDSKTENGPGTSNGAGPSKSTDDGEEVDDDKDEDGEVNNLQLAWEILEMAKIIFQKQIEGGASTKETKIKLSEVLLKLGEVGIESENWPTAIDDLKACLSIQGDVLDPDDRRVAETFYHLAIAYSNNHEYQESIDAYEKACNQLQARIHALEAKRPKEDMINQTLIDSEIKELQDLLVEMKERLDDTKTEKDEPTPKDDQDDVVKNGSESKPVSNIAHLVRKKPKAESSDAAPESKSEVKAGTVDKTEEESTAGKRKSEDDEAASLSAVKKAKVQAEA